MADKAYSSKKNYKLLNDNNITSYYSSKKKYENCNKLINMIKMNILKRIKIEQYFCKIKII